MGNVGIGTEELYASAVLQVDSSSKGLLPPRMTTSQRLAIASPVDGLIVFDTTESDLFIQSEQEWIGLIGSLEKDDGEKTFVDDWPDAIYCLGSSWDVVLYLSWVYVDGSRYYSTPWGAAYGVRFDSDGLYSSHTNLANVDCVSNAMGIDQLEDLDRTFNLVGGGGSDNDNVWTSFGSDVFLDSGNVGIGTTGPTSRLDVDGSIRMGDGGEPCDSSTEGTQRYNYIAKEMEFCDSDDWRPFALGMSDGGGDELLAIIEDQKPSGTHGGSFSGGAWRTRDLNELVYNKYGNVTLASNQFTINPNGSETFIIKVEAPALEVDLHQVRLRDITAGVTAGAGTSINSDDEVTTTSKVTAVVTIDAATTFEIQHYADRSNWTVGFGEAANSGEVEVYTRVQIKRQN